MNFPMISVIMPSLLSEYEGCAKNRIIKFRRAVDSFLKQSYPNKELIVVADGCKQTVKEVLAIKNGLINNNVSKQIVLAQTSKDQKQFSGLTRNLGISTASGDVICYLDTDDALMPWHLDFIATNFINTQFDWIYFDDHKAMSSNLNLTEIRRFANLNEGGIGTSNIAHKKSLQVNWRTGYGHDFDFVKELMNKSGIYTKAKRPGGYIVCHIPNDIDY